MPDSLSISLGQYSHKGRKEVNQDFHGALVPEAGALALKGISIALADGISSSEVGALAAETAVKTFLTDYYCTSDSWTVKTSAGRVISAANSWLYSQGRRSQYAFDQDKGYACTLSVLVLKSRTAHLFHVGDSRIYRLSGGGLEQLTTDHRVVLSSEEVYLGRALGVGAEVEVDYQALPVMEGDVFLLATDGVYEFADPGFVVGAIRENAEDLGAAARRIGEEAMRRGSQDNLTLQIVCIDGLPSGEVGEVMGESAGLPLPPLLEARTEFDGYRIVRQLHASNRSHIYLAEDMEDGARVVIKIPSVDLRGDAAYLRRFLMEEWIGRRLNSAHILKNHITRRRKNYLYLVTEYVEGQTLAQWMTDHPRPDLEVVRSIVEQVARGLRAFHRLEMVHQDLRPENIMIDGDGTVKIIDFGSTRVAGVIEAQPDVHDRDILGTIQYAAPEYFLGETGTPGSDIFSLGVIAYQMLTGRLPYGARMARARTRSRQRKLPYMSAAEYNTDLPEWVDGALAKAVHADPFKRYNVLSEFEHDLRRPNPEFMQMAPVPFAERDPVFFWKSVALFFALVSIGFVLARLM
ncbi:protein kinase domain-containing protein [Emcibacter sp.]|uniref:protein kinase domain-containing protein n=1 Tax=Emcibacter sp. TaxID=1979954 RepID=UPI003A93FC78